MPFKDPVKAREYAAAWRSKNKDRAYQGQLEWKKQNNTPLRRMLSGVYANEYYKNNKESRKISRSKYKSKNKDKILAQSKIYNARNPDVHRLCRNRRRAKIAGSSTSDRMIIKAWLKRLRLLKTITCYWCREIIDVSNSHIDHIEPLSKGGSHSIDNLCMSCPSCNKKKNAMTLSDWNQRLDQPVLI